MKRGSIIFLKTAILLVAIGTFAALIKFPQTEGRAANLDLISIYKDPFIIYIYIASIPFFVGLYQAFKLLTFISSNKAFSKEAIKTLGIMKFASLGLIGFIVLAEIYIRLFAHGDDPAGPTALGVMIMFVFGAIATATGVIQNLLQNAHDLKSENDLTV